MENYNTQIAERIKALQEQNEQRAKEAEKADKAVADGSYKSNPVAEQVKPKPKNKNKNKKKEKQTVTVQERHTAEIEGMPKEAEIPPVREETTTKEEPTVKEGKPSEKQKKDALRASFDEVEGLFGGNPAEAEPPASSPTKEHPKERTHKGPHKIMQKKVKYVDMSGNEIKSFCLIEEATGEIRNLKDVTTIGKSDSANITLQNRYVSRMHARVTCEEGEFFIEDLGSTNGTFVNGVEIKEKTRIEIGDQIELAALKLVFDAAK